MMETAQPLNPYLALGVPKDATAADIKSAYRKLVLKCHPDKVSDESLKAEKQKEFHNIQEAYELIGEDEKRQKYDAQARLEELRKDVFAQKSTGVRPEKYNIRTAVPPWATYNFPPSPQPAFDSRRGPSFAFFDEDDFYREGSWTSSRKYELYEPVPTPSSKRSSPRTERTKSKPSGAGDRSRNDRRKSREQETRRDRDGKFAYIDEDSYLDERMRYEDGYRRRNEEERRRERYTEEQIRQHQQSQQHKRHHSASETDKSVESDDDHYTSQWHKMRSQTSSARDYIERKRTNGSISLDSETVPSAHRPSMSRSASSASARYVEVRRSSDSRPSTVRRSSARSKDSHGSSNHDKSHHSSSSSRHKDRDRDRDRKGTMPEIVEYPATERPSRRNHSSTAAAAEDLRSNGIRRSYTSIDDMDRRSSDQNIPFASVRRADTMPVKSSSSGTIPTSPHLAPHSSSRRKEPHPANSSKLRTSEQADDSGYSSPNSDKAINGGGNSAPNTTSTKYFYSSNGDDSSARLGPTLSPADEPIRYRTVIREPPSVSTPKLSRGATFTATSTVPISHSKSRSRSRSRERDRDRRHRKTESRRTAARPAPQPHQPGGGGGSSGAHDQHLFGEISPTAPPSNPHPSYSTPAVPSFTSSKSMPTYKAEVSYGKRFGPEDIRYSSRRREEMGRSIIEQVRDMGI